MEMRRRFSLFRSCLFLLLMFLLSLSLGARGRDEKNYRESISLAFENIIAQMESGTLNGEEGKARLAQVRSAYRTGYTDFDGMLDSLIDNVSEGRISPAEALQLFRTRRKPLSPPLNSEKDGDRESGGDRDETDRGSHNSSGGTSGSNGSDADKGKNGP